MWGGMAEVQSAHCFALLAAESVKPSRVRLPRLLALPVRAQDLFPHHSAPEKKASAKSLPIVPVVSLVGFSMAALPVPAGLVRRFAASVRLPAAAAAPPRKDCLLVGAVIALRTAGQTQ